MKIRLIQPAQLDDRGKLPRFKKLFMPFLTMPTAEDLRRVVERVMFFPRDLAVEEIFFQSHRGWAIAGGTHPFTLGLRTDSP